MFDSQKLSFDKWLMGYKHGVYVFTSDSCSICKDYKESIKDINNHYLYFVEVVTEEQKKVLSKVIGRGVLPCTAFYKDAKLEEVKTGMLFDTQMATVMQYLKQFGDAPLTMSEIEERIEKIKTRAQLTYYVFTQTVSKETRLQILATAFDRHELAVDVDDVIALNDTQAIQLLSGPMEHAKLVVWKDGKSNIPSSRGQSTMFEYQSMKWASDNVFEVRNIDEVLK